MQCFKPAWDHGFTVDRNLKGWRLEGLIPFNRNALWRKHSSNAKPLSLFRASTGHSAIAAAIPSPSPAADSLSLAAQDLSPAAQDPSPSAAPSLPAIPGSVAEAIQFVKRKDKLPTSGGPLSYEELLAAYIRLQDSSSVVAEFVEASGEQEPNAPAKERILARNVFNKRGSATGPEARAIAKANHDLKQAEKDQKAARDEEKKQKKALDVAAAVTQGARVLQAIELHGEAQLHRLTIVEIVALLVHADPQGNNPKPKTKRDGLERARALPTVQAALERRVLAVAANVFPGVPLDAPAPAPAALPPQPFFPVFEDPNGVYRPSIGSFESSGEVEAPTVPVGPDAL